MARDKTSHGNRKKGRIKGSGILVIPRLKKVPLRRELSTNMNKHYAKVKKFL